MKRKLLLLLTVITGMVSSAWAKDYTISTPDELLAFAQAVNSGETSANASLTANIDLKGKTWTPIGTESYKYTGTFDGGGFTILNFSLSTTGDRAGLFGYLSGGAVVKNFTIEGSITSNNHQYVGAIGSADGGTVTISNIHSKLNITCSKSRHGGILGSQTGTGTVNIDRCTYSGKMTVIGNVTGNFGGIVGLTNNNTSAYVNITDCLFDGEIDDGTGDNAGGIVGYTNGTVVTIKNCLSKGSITAAKPGQFFGQLNGKNSTCNGKNYYVAGNVVGNLKSGVSLKGTAPVTATTEQLANGEICYELNGKDYGTNWFQSIGDDDYPTPNGTDVVYIHDSYDCDMTPMSDDISYTNTPDITPHNYGGDGFCTVCGALKQDENGYYGIGNAKALRWFAAYVNAGNYTVNAKLTGDVDMTGEEWPDPIGNWTNSAAYKGHFDGQGYAINGLEYETARNYHGIFGVLSNDAIVENFTVYGTVTANTSNTFGVIAFARDNSVIIRNITSYLNFETVSGKLVGGILGNSYAGVVNIDRCSYFGSIQITDDTDAGGNYGGIVGYIKNSADAIANITNCLFDGEIAYTGAKGQCGGIVGTVGANSKYNVKNCLSIGTVTSTEASTSTAMICGIISSSNGIAYDNNYYKGDAANGSASVVTETAEVVTNSRLASGEVCYMLNGDQTTIAWYQAVGTDDDPTLDSTHGVVYINGTVCPDTGTPQGSVSYSNIEGTTIGNHVNVDGFCTYCGTIQEDYMTANGEGNLEIGTPAQLKWFAAYVNQVDPAVDAVLTTDIDLDGVEWTPIGKNVYYTGTFDGQDFAISNFNYTGSGDYNGLFGRVKDATIKNFSIGGALVCAGSGSGVVGWSEGSLISRIHSALKIETPATGAFHHAGGIVGGGRYGGTKGGTTVELCDFNGTMTVNAESSDCFGGIVGYTNEYCTFNNCVNYGTISFAKNNCYAGGIIGYINSDACKGAHNCLNLGTVKYTGEGDASYGGAIVGRLRGNNPELWGSNYYLAGTYSKGCGENQISTNYEVTSAQLASGEVAYKLGAAFGQTIGTESTPVFGGEAVSYVGAAGYATMYDTTTGYELNGDVKAYVATFNNTWLDLTEIDNVPASTPVILKGGYYNKTAATLAPIDITNVLQGTAEEIDAAGMYVLAKPADKAVGFYLADGGKIAAGKAYLEVPGSEVKGFIFAEDDETAINDLTSALSESGTIYNVAGQRINKLQKGINIVNGKKVLR